MGEGEMTPLQNAKYELAKILHESGRKAVEQGKVFMKGPDITPRPFAEWLDLPEDALVGRFMMADFLVEHASEVIALLEATLPVSVDTTEAPAVEAHEVANKGHVEGAV